MRNLQVPGDIRSQPEVAPRQAVAVACRLVPGLQGLLAITAGSRTAEPRKQVQLAQVPLGVCPSNPSWPNPASQTFEKARGPIAEAAVFGIARTRFCARSLACFLVAALPGWPSPLAPSTPHLRRCGVRHRRRADRLVVGFPVSVTCSMTGATGAGRDGPRSRTTRQCRSPVRTRLRQEQPRGCGCAAPRCCLRMIAADGRSTLPARGSHTIG